MGLNPKELAIEHARIQGQRFLHYSHTGRLSRNEKRQLKDDRRRVTVTEHGPHEVQLELQGGNAPGEPNEIRVRTKAHATSPFANRRRAPWLRFPKEIPATTVSILVEKPDEPPAMLYMQSERQRPADEGTLDDYRNAKRRPKDTTPATPEDIRTISRSGKELWRQLAARTTRINMRHYMRAVKADLADAEAIVDGSSQT